jgi:pyruvate formate lyase activating enzyme
MDREKCVKCGVCSEACPCEAIEVCGRTFAPSELLETVFRDAPFWRRSGGGVTVSGGEALSQPVFLFEFLELCRQRSVHTAIETCLFASLDTVRRLASLVDFIQFDIKAMSKDLHERLTSLGNENILRNAEYLLRKTLPLVVRYPLVPGCNDSEDELDALGDFLAQNRPGVELEILPYHRMGVGKYKALGLEYSLHGTAPPSKVEMSRAAEILERYPIEVIYQRSKD